VPISGVRVATPLALPLAVEAVPIATEDMVCACVSGKAAQSPARRENVSVIDFMLNGWKAPPQYAAAPRRVSLSTHSMGLRRGFLWALGNVFKPA
jgi:hypothetical protein